MKFPTEKPLDNTDEDLFGYYDLAGRLIKNVFLQMETPNCFGLYGNWGAGKSTLQYCIASRIEESFSDEIKVIKFDAWQYEYADDKDLLFALIRTLSSELGGKQHWKEVLIIAATLGYSLTKTLGSFAQIELPDAEEASKNYNVIENEVYEEHERWVDKTQELHGAFRLQIAKFLEAKGYKKLLIIVDDLDRCLPENAIKLLEGIKNYLHVEGVIFVLAIDRRVIADMVEKKYQLRNGFGDEYLAKIIHYHYELPKVHLVTIVDIMFSRHNIEISGIQKNFITALLHDTAKEPRVAKFYLNQFFITLALSDSAAERLEKHKTDSTLEYLFLASFLLTKYPKIFLTENLHRLLSNIRESNNSTHNPDRRADYQQITSQYPIDVETRKELETLLARKIHNVEGTGNIDLGLLANMMLVLKKGNYDYMTVKPSDISE